MKAQPKIGLVLANLGGPTGPHDARSFLRRLLSDADVVGAPWPVRPLLARWVARRRGPRVIEHLRAIGGRSPLAAETRAQVEALRAVLGPGWAVRYAFRHAEPFAADVLAGLAAEGVRRLVALPAYPQWSRSTSGSALDDLQRAADRAGLELAAVDAFCEAEGYLAALADGVRPLLDGAEHLIVSAHGLPQRMVAAGDPYREQTERTAAALIRALDCDLPWTLAFQSRLGPVEWTRPYLSDVVAELGAAGVHRLVVAPVSFVCENLETRWELDCELVELARAAGIAELRRAPAPGSHPAFIATLAALARERARAAGWEQDDGL